LPETEMVYCGLSLGYPDKTDPVNSLRTQRADVDQFAVFKGF
jgi:hypothetical protein